MTGGAPPAQAAASLTQRHGKDNSVGLAAALMAGVCFAFDQRWVLDVGYRAQYLAGSSVDVTSPSTAPSPTQLSKGTMGDHWEHQVRVGLRFNIW